MPTRPGMDRPVTNKPDVSVIIPMHNAGATVTGVVESFLGSMRPAVEVLVVDDARPTTRSNE